MFVTLQVSQGCDHWVFLLSEIHEHLHPDLLLQRLHDGRLVVQLLPQLGDGGVRLLLEAAQALLELRHLPRQHRDLHDNHHHHGDQCQYCPKPWVLCGCESTECRFKTLLAWLNLTTNLQRVWQSRYGYCSWYATLSECKNILQINKWFQKNSCNCNWWNITLASKNQSQEHKCSLNTISSLAHCGKSGKRDNEA